MLELKHIYFERENRKILEDVNLKIQDDTCVVITGPNGSGKSTLAKIMMGIEKPDSGQVIYNGTDITNQTVDQRARMGIAFAFQQPVRFKGITVYDIIKLSTGNTMSRKEACDILSTVGLCAREYVDREVNASLSGGELKRIEIASVIARKAQCTIFDEPEAGIDLWSFSNLITVFKNMRKETKATTLIISHQERILNIADQIVLVNAGKIEKVGPKEEMLDKVLKRTRLLQSYRR